MARADEIHFVRPNVCVWQAYEPAVKTDLTCCAHRTARGWIFIDPISLTMPALDEMRAIAEPAAVVLTNGNHARAANDFRQRFSIPVHAHADAAAELGMSVDHLIGDGEMIADELTVITLPGAAAGELALVGDGVLHIGDALIHLPSHGFTTLPDKYCSDARELRRSLGKLLRLPFEVLTFAHGLPIVARAAQRLSQLLA